MYKRFANLPRLLYTLVVLSILPWALAHLLWRARRQADYLRHWGERFGFFSADVKKSDAGAHQVTPTIWLHAVSVGETRAAQPLVAALRVRFPDHSILFTHMTPTGRATSEAVFGTSVQRVYLPYDTPWAMRRFLRRYQPALGLIMETELWPNLIAACAEARVPLLLVNARLSDRSGRRYAWFPELTRGALQGLTAIGAQTDQDAARLRSLGASAPVTTGNMKFDIDPPASQQVLAKLLRDRFGQRPVWLAASTREGEEALILDAWRRLELTNGTLTPLLVIVPRHPPRFEEVARLAVDSGFSIQRRSDDAAIAPATQVLIGDSMGEMFAWYGAVDVAFIGGSLLDFGSQNLIEACAVGTPVVIGRYTRNFAEAASGALACGAACAIEDANQLVAEINALLADSKRRQLMSEAGRAFAAYHRGATGRTMALIEKTLDNVRINRLARNNRASPCLMKSLHEEKQCGFGTD